MIRRGIGPVAVAIAVVASLLAPPALAGDPQGEVGHDDSDRDDATVEQLQDLEPLVAKEFAEERDASLTTPVLALPTPTLRALPALPASFALPVQAARGTPREFDTSHGEVDPRVRQVPRTHRFRLALQTHWIRLTRTQNPDTGEYERFHYVPLHIDLAYQAQFLRWVMVRLAVGIGGNLANTRNAMPVSVFPQAYVGYQGKIAGVAFGYGFDWTIPPIDGAAANSSFALPQPVIRRNHTIMGEFSVTSRIDRVALTFALAIGGMQSQLTHFDTANKRFRFYLGLHAGAFFDGTIRREKKARKAAAQRG